MTDVPSDADKKADDFRAKLGGRLVLWSTIGLILLAAVVMIASLFTGEKSDPMRAAQLLLSSLLPLFGTWVGTVLAFYYTRDNFQAATRGTLDIVKSVSQRLASTTIRSAMRPRSEIVALEVPETGLADIKLSDIEDKFDTKLPNKGKVSRVHFYLKDGRAVAVLHSATWAEMKLDGVLDKTTPVDLSKDKFGALIGRAYASAVGKTYEDLITRTIAFVGIEQTLADAKAALAAIPGCQDAIVTKTGDSGEAALGWVSNSDIGRLSVA